jgi:hypothetical protein
MKRLRLYRLILALFVVAFSSASAVHDAAHDCVHLTDESRYAGTQDHTEVHHSDNCLFCAKGPAVSLEAETEVFSFISHVEFFRSAEIVTRTVQTCNLLASLRAPPTA